MQDKDLHHRLNEALSPEANDENQSPLRKLFRRRRAQEERCRNLPDDCDEALRDVVFHEIEQLQQQAADFEPRTMEDLIFKIIFADDNGDMSMNGHQKELAAFAYKVAGIDQATGQELETPTTKSRADCNKFKKVAEFASVELSLEDTTLPHQYHLYETLSAVCDLLAATLCLPSHSKEAGAQPNPAGNVVDSLIECFWHINDEIVSSIGACSPTSHSELENRSEFLLKVYAQYGLSSAEMASRAANFASQELLLLRKQKAAKILAA